MFTAKSGLIGFILLSLSLHAFSAQSLDKNEQAIVAWAEASAEPAIDLIEKLVNINSGTRNIQGVKDVGAVLRAELDGLGFETRWIDMPEEMGRAGHLFGKVKVDRSEKMLLIGHLDTVFEPSEGVQSFVRDGATATGPGTDDMKSGNVVIIYAL